ncbi:hypothetical protein LDENG_00034030 [Lucifuga dentata]|nr:hypothetical protein LDENG_00034030 [Lucifuga dentata]
MAAKETINTEQTDVESVISRWLVDYYVSLSIELFKKGLYSDFCAVRNILNGVVNRNHMEWTDQTLTKYRLLLFLSRINEGDRLDQSFESDRSVTPLESAIILLEDTKSDSSILQQEIENAITSIQEMLVVICIKNSMFKKAKQVLKHFPKGSKKAIFMDLISQNGKNHEILEQVTFSEFKEKMLEFCQRLCPFTATFLYKAATELISKRHGREEQEGKKADEQDTSDLPSALQISIRTVSCNQIIIQKTRLKAAYVALVAGTDGQTFDQVQEEMETESEERKENLYLHLTLSPIEMMDVESQQEEHFQKDSGSPMEASPADQALSDAVPQPETDLLSKETSTLRKRRLHTVAQLVMEPDSQGSSQCLVASQELEAEVRIEESAQSVAISNKEDLQSSRTESEVTKPVRKHSRKTSKRRNKNSAISSDSEDDTHAAAATSMCTQAVSNQFTNTSSSKNSTEFKQTSSDMEEDPRGSVASSKIPLRKHCKQQASSAHSMSLSNTDEIIIEDTSLDSSPNLFPDHPAPQESSTPQDSAKKMGAFHKKWKRLFDDAKESKDTWSDEELLFSSETRKDDDNKSTISNSSQKRKKWTNKETQMLKEAVEKFGEGNWNKIKAYYPFKGRTNVNLKDRWRTMKKLNLA